jgi:hypothetical protein
LISLALEKKAYVRLSIFLHLLGHLSKETNVFLPNL